MDLSKMTLEELNERERVIRTQQATLRIVKRDYRVRKTELEAKLERAQVDLDGLERAYASATSGGIEECDRLVKDVEDARVRLLAEPKMAQVRQLRAKLARELGVPEADVTSALDKLMPELRLKARGGE